MRNEARVQRIRVDREDFFERVEGEVPRADAVVAGEHELGDRARAPVELAEPRRALKRLETVGFGVAPRRVRRAQLAYEHIASSRRHGSAGAGRARAGAPPKRWFRPVAPAFMGCRPIPAP